MVESHHKEKPVSGHQKGYVTCKLFQHATLVLALVILAGDVELNPRYQNMADIRKARGLKIAHLNIRSLRHKTDSLRVPWTTGLLMFLRSPRYG